MKFNNNFININKLKCLFFLFSVIFLIKAAEAEELINKKEQDLTNKKAESLTNKKVEKKNNLKRFMESGILVETSLENNNGVAIEDIYSNNKKISELKWKFQDILMSRIKLGILLDNSFSLNLSYATSNNNSHNSKMTDYDWLGGSGSQGGDDGKKDPANWTHYSSSIVKTNIKDFDIHSNSIFFENYSFKIGFRQQEFDFHDKSQDYVYSCNEQYRAINNCQIGFRNLSGNFNNENSINYYQRFRIPYIGIGFDKKFFNKKLSLSLYSVYSSTVYANDRDVHVRRSMIIERNFKKGKYYNIGAKIAYNFYDNFRVNLGYEYTQIPLIIGDSNYSYSDGTQNYSSQNSAGISNKFQKIALGLSYLFYIN